jgi:hypothetical protein
VHLPEFVAEYLERMKNVHESLMQLIWKDCLQTWAAAKEINNIKTNKHIKFQQEMRVW